MDLKEHKDGVYSQKALIEKGKERIKEGDRSFIDAKINSEEMQMMLFTSGTTQKSKVVALSHKIICTNLMDFSSVLKIHKNDTLLSFLPLHHAFECTTGFLNSLYNGAAVAYCDGIRHIVENLKEYEISVMISVPVLFENIYKKTLKNIEKKGKLAKIQKGLKINNILKKVHIDLKKQLFKGIRENIGEKVRLFISGAAPLDPEVEKGYNELGIRIMQGYGLTETAPIISLGTDDHYRLGSVRTNISKSRCKNRRPRPRRNRRNPSKRSKCYDWILSK